MIGYHNLESQTRELNWNKLFSDEEINNNTKNTAWEFASKNEDDDFHTDVVFLRTACGAIAEEIGYCHTKTLLMYKKYCGEFYFTKENTKRLCDVIIDKLKKDSIWRNNFNKEIYSSADGLSNVYNGLRREEIEQLSLDELCNLYEKQYKAQIELYKKCWIAEVIQVPGVGLADHLIDYLKSFGISEAEAENVFYSLTRSYKDSVYVEEEKKVIEIAEYVLGDSRLNKLFKEPIKHLRTYVTPYINDKIEEIQSKYGYLGYHGFGDREPYHKDDYIARVKEYVTNASKIQIEKGKWERQSEEKNSQVHTLREKMDKLYTELFVMYGELAVSKAYRRLAQLKNFYFLDFMIGVIARKLELPESYLRFMVPEEIISLLRGEREKVDINNIEKRTSEMVYMILDGEELIFVGKEAQKLRSKMEGVEEVSSNILKGRSACMGACKGRAVIVERSKDIHDFKCGDVLVSLEADPDLIPLMKMAGAIVTDQGGITCHAAVIAREFNIPCVIGTINATKLIKTGDIVYVDANKGEIIVGN
ncbi:PEP-utilizing enzyme [Inconstantimicrobium mannanitabidum]|uniref:Uncharacterized protein n=1 Tax=Inconstantimicrobium mannanitabidum TaxID=1604901 RepID=A0ACB5R874_9CLOT|nr:PEP-utilizing enzyme [Clostridium sp. TW13]GKX65203.1 hypothetical protein rsdtw13_04610 [Clostridium sp. TW13]